MRVATLLLVLAMVACGGTVHAQWAIIPQPQKVEAGRGSFVLGPDTRIVAPADARGREIGAFLREAIQAQAGLALTTDASANGSHIALRIDPAVHGDEAYRLTVAPGRIDIAAADERGLFWGVQTLFAAQPPKGALGPGGDVAGLVLHQLALPRTDLQGLVAEETEKRLCRQ